jgi:DNA-directed RNA polymerase subunit F
MIRDTKSLSLVEANKYIEEEEIKIFLKKFTKIKLEDAEKLREEINNLENIKIKTEHISKIIDTLPEDTQDLAKIFVDASLDEDENSKILEIVKKYK